MAGFCLLGGIHLQRSLVERKIQLLRDFAVQVTPEMVSYMESIKSNEVTLDQYVHKTIKENLYKGDYF